MLRSLLLILAVISALLGLLTESSHAQAGTCPVVTASPVNSSQASVFQAYDVSTSVCFAAIPVSSSLASDLGLGSLRTAIGFIQCTSPSCGIHVGKGRMVIGSLFTVLTHQATSNSLQIIPAPPVAAGSGVAFQYSGLSAQAEFTATFRIRRNSDNQLFDVIATKPAGSGIVNNNPEGWDAGVLTVNTVTDTAPVISSNGSAATASVTVNENQTVVTNVETNDDFDAEGAGLVYSLTGGADQTLFSINANTGVLAFSVAPDFETPADTGGNNVYNVQVTVTDTNGGTDIQDIAVTVAGVVEGARTGDITIIQSIIGPDTSVSFSSPTGPLNVKLTTVSGTAQISITGVSAGTHKITSTDLLASGYAVTSIVCNGNGSTGDIKTRTATINLAAAAHVICTFTMIETRQHTSRMIADYLGARNTLLLAHQPDSGRRMSRLQKRQNHSITGIVSAYGVNLPVPLQFNASVGEHVLSFDTSLSSLAKTRLGAATLSNHVTSFRLWDIWTEGHIARFDDKASNGGSFGVVYAGIDYVLNPGVLVGVMAQYDWLNQAYGPGLLNVSGNSRISGSGWMVGPYTTIKLNEQFYLDTRAAWGRSRNSISPFGTYEDTFETQRWLVSAALIGQFAIDNWAIQPGLAFQYIAENQYSYIDGLGVSIPEQTVAQGNIRFGPRIGYSHKLNDDMWFNPWMEFAGVYSFADQGKFTRGSLASNIQDLTGSLKAGFDLTTANGLSFMVSGQYDGIGADAQSYGATLKLSMPLN